MPQATPGAGIDKANALLKFGAQAMWAMRLEEARDAFTKAAEIAKSAGDERVHARALARLQFGVLPFMGRVGELQPVIAEAGMASLKQGSDAVAGLIIASCHLRFLAPDDPDAVKMVQRFVKEAEQHPRDVDVARATGQVAIACNAMGDHELAASLLERALPVMEAALGAGHPEVGLMLYNLADVRGALDGYRTFDRLEPMFRRAIAIQEAALAPGHPERVAPMATTGLFLARRGSYEEAQRLLDRALSIAVEIEGPGGATPQMVRSALAELDAQLVDANAEPYLLKRVQAAENDPAAEPYDVAERLTALCRHYFVRGKPGSAEPHYRKLRAIADGLGDMAWTVRRLPGHIYRLLQEDRGAEAEKLLMGELATMERVLPAGHDDLLRHLYFTGNVYRMMGRHQDALRIFERHAAAERKRSEADPQRADGLTRLLDAQLELGQKKDAERTAAEIERLTGKKPVMDPALNEFARQLQSVWHMLQLEEFPDLIGAALKGDPLAGLVVGLCFAVGQGVPRNLDKARPWFEAAVKSGNSTVNEFIEEMSRDVSRDEDQPADFSLIASAAKAWLEGSATAV